MEKFPVAIIGTGNIGTDLMFKVRRCQALELKLFAGIDPKSRGIALAQGLKVRTSTRGIEEILNDKEIKLVFDCTGAKAHLLHAPLLKQAGMIAIDLTPAKVGPPVVPSVNLSQHLSEKNVNLISCAAQATIPIIAAIARATKVKYVESISSLASASVGPEARKNIDEFVRETKNAIIEITGVPKAKVISSVNPTEPPPKMRNCVYAETDGTVNESVVQESVHDMVIEVKRYVPGYNIVVEPFFDVDHITTIVEVEGAADFLPSYAGNLDIINAAAIRVAEKFAETL